MLGATRAACDLGIASVLGCRGLTRLVASRRNPSGWKLSRRRGPDHHLVGGALMVSGGVLALGCHHRPGVSGFPRSRIGSFLAVFRHHRRRGAPMKIQYWG